MTGRRGGGGRARPRAASPAARLASIVLWVTAAGLVPAWQDAESNVPAQPVVPESAAMAGTEDYCTGYGRTFHGEWEAAGRGGRAGGAPAVLFRIGVNGDGKACYAQLNARTPPGVAPYELPRFGAKATGGGAWTLRYRNTVLEIDTGSGTVVRREGGKVARSGVLRARAPPVADSPPPPPARERKRWHGWWEGRFPGAPFRVALRFSDARGEGHVRGRISMLLMKQTFTGRFHGEMLVFRWRNRHVGLLMEPGGETLVYTDYKGRVSRFERVR